MFTNIHPMIVHFPIALLTMYSIIEIAHLPWLTTPFWFRLKAFFLITGSSIAIITLQTGELIEKKFPGKLTEVHSNWANFTAYFYALFALAYLIALVSETNLWEKRLPNNALTRAAKKLASLLTKKWYLAIPAALIGLTSITITGALGGAIVYGPNIDPVVTFIYNLLVK